MTDDAQVEAMTLDAPPQGHVLFRVAARTHVGVERSNNEDRVLVADLASGVPHVGAFGGELRAENGGALLAVCDGMGGEAGGEVASTTAVETLFRSSVQSLPGRSENEVARGLAESVRIASQAIEARAEADRALSRMGTTATVCTVAGDSLLVAQVGDSRAYLLRGGVLHQLTRDQTLKTLLVERGQLTPEQAGEFQHNNIILQALGHKGGVEVDLGWVGICQGDVLLLCSDGLYGCVPDDRIAQTLSGGGDLGQACDALIELALQAGAPDNVTVLVAYCHGALPPPTGEMPTLRKIELAPSPPNPA
jgi:protein phosphatase